MDESAVWTASEEQLKNLGLLRQGDIISLKSFVMPAFLNNDTLVKEIKNAGAERSRGKSKAASNKTKPKKVYIGLKVYERRIGKYKGKRGTNGGGLRATNFSTNATKDQILERAKKFFFPNGRSSIYGSAKTFQFQLASFDDTIIPSSFVLHEHIERLGLTRVRLYLLAKKKSVLNLFEDSDDDFEDNMNSVIENLCNYNS